MTLNPPPPPLLGQWATGALMRRGNGGKTGHHHLGQQPSPNHSSYAIAHTQAFGGWGE